MDWGLAKLIGKSEAEEPGVLTGERDGRVEGDRAPGAAEESLLTRDGQIIGTPPSMFPEQARGDLAAVDERTDIYAMGAVLYQILTGRPPYQNRGEALHKLALLDRVRQGPPERIQALCSESPAELVAICEKAMARDPADRYARMEAMAADIRAYLEGRVVRAHRVGPIIELRKWIGRNRATAAALLAALLMALGGLGLANYISYSKQRQIAEKNTQLITSNEALDRSRRNILGLADQRRAEEALAEAENELWPRRPDKVSRMSEWLELTRELVDRIDRQQAFLDQLDKAPAETGPAETTGGPVERDWLRSQLEGLLANLRRLRDQVVPDVERRLAMAATIEQKTVDDHADEWAEAIEAILDDPRFNDLEIEPQKGFVPIGPDPGSGLQEFWVWETGERPERDEDSGRIQITEKMGMVLVLLPRGEFLMGAQKEDPEKPHFDPSTEGDEIGRTQPVRLQPFFISKYEMTQGQWLRLMGDNPSTHLAGWIKMSHQITLVHPVETVSWNQAREALRRLGLELPTEAEWEYACRAGTGTIWWTGDTVASLQDSANLADRSLRDYAHQPAEYCELTIVDGYATHSPVGSYRPNAFGLHDMAGNVAEFCLDALDANPPAPRRHEAYTLPPEAANFRVTRGGTFMTRAKSLRSANRGRVLVSEARESLGIRPVAHPRGP